MPVVDTQTFEVGVLWKKIVHDSAVEDCQKLLWPKCG